MGEKKIWRAAPWIAIALLVYSAVFATELYENITLGHIGDYAFDSYPGIELLTRGEFWAVYGLDPAPLMLPLPLILQAVAIAPFQWLGLGSIDWPGLYVAADASYGVARFLIGTVFLLIVSTGAVWATIRKIPDALTPIREAAFGVIIVAFFLLNPVTTAAVYWGHPEEVLMGALLCAAFAAIAREKWVWSAFWLGLAVATKQPALLFLPAVILAWPVRQRMKSFGVFFGTAFIISAPFLLPQIGNVIHQQLAVSAPNSIDHLASFRINVYDALGLADSLAWSSRAIIFGSALFIPLWLARWRLRDQLGVEKLLPAISLIALIRIAFDPYNIAYYALPLLVALLVLELYQYRVGAHFLQTARYRLGIPIPIITIVSMTAYGLVTMPDPISTAMYDGFGSGALGATLVCAPIAAWLILLLIKGISFKVRGRVILSAALAYLALAIVVAIAPSSRNETPVDHTPPPDGYIYVDPEEAAVKIAPERIYELSDKVSDRLSLPRRFAAVRGDVPLFNNTVGPDKSVKPLTFLDYGPSDDGLKGVSVFTFQKKNSKPYEKIIRSCERGDCPEDSGMEDGPLGEMLVTQDEPNDPWEARVLVHQQIVYVLILDPGSYPPEQVMSGIEPVPVTKAD